MSEVVYTNVLAVIRPLTQDERTRAQKSAELSLASAIGSMPTREQFAVVSKIDNPVYVSGIVAIALLIVFFAAGSPSLFRLFTAGRNYFLMGIQDANQAAIAGLGTFLLAEFMVIASTLAMRVFFEGRSKWIMLIPIALGSAVAFVGNWVVEQPNDAFGILLTVAPPFGVLFMSMIGEHIIFANIKQRRASERAFQEALASYKVQIGNLQKHEYWNRFYANAVLERLQRANKSKQAKELFASMSDVQRLALFNREKQSDAWFEDANAQQEHLQMQSEQRQQNEQLRLERLQQRALQSGAGGGQHTGEVDNAPMQKQNGMHVAECPHCNYKTEPKDSEVQAKRALSAHLKRHKQIANANELAAVV